MKTLEQIKDEHAKELGFTDFEEMFSEATHTGIDYCVDAVAVKYAEQILSFSRGLELIAKKRKYQIEKHGRTIDKDVENYKFAYGNMSYLTHVAESLMKRSNSNPRPPVGFDTHIFYKMISKPYKERLIIAGALIAAEIDIELNR